MANRKNPRPTLGELSYAELEAAVARLVKRSRVTKSGCWVTETRKYSQVSIRNWPFLGHVVAWRLFRGDIPDDLELDHFECQYPPCWNPWHVDPVTHYENMARHHEQKFGQREALPPIWERQPGYSSSRVRGWREANREHVHEYDAAYYAKNKDRLNARVREWKRNRRSEQKG